MAVDFARSPPSSQKLKTWHKTDGKYIIITIIIIIIIILLIIIIIQSLQAFRRAWVDGSVA